MRSSYLLYIFCIFLLLFSSIPVVSAEGGYELVAKWGNYGSGDGQFNSPYGIAVDSAGNVYVVDRYNDRIQKFTSDGIFITQWGHSEKSNVYPYDTIYNLVCPWGIEVDSADNVYVTDDIGQILMFTSAGTFIKRFYYQNQDWPDYTYPVDVAVDSAGNIYALYNNHIVVVELTSTNDYIKSWYIGEGQSRGIALDSAGNVYIVANRQIQKFTSDGTYLAQWSGDGTRNGQFNAPSGIAIDSANNVYVCDNNQIQKFTSTGTFITKWGGPGSEDGQVHAPLGIAVDNAGYVYVSDNVNSRIQKFAPTGITPTTTVTPQPIVASFTATPTSGSAPLTVQFTDTSTGSITGWQWDFNNDGIVDSTLQNPTFTYTEPGNYSVKLSVTGNGGTKSTVKTNYIAVNGGISVDSITPAAAVLTVENVAVSVQGKNFPAGTTFKLVNATLGTITCQPNTITRVSDTELTGKISFTDVKEGLYDVVVTAPDGTTKSLEKGFRVLPVPVVLIYGWHGAPGAWDVLRPALSKEGIDYWDFDYNTSIDPTVSANTLSDFIQKKRLTYKRDLYPNGYTGKIDIVCHSMGAIVSRWYMEQKGHGNEIRQWIGIAPAHGGSAGADSQSFQNEGSDDSTTTGWQYLICSIFGDSTRYLQTNSGAEQILKYDQISPSTTYRVIAGWNPHHDVQFGYGALYRTRAVAPNGSYYWTFNGDMIVAAAQSYHKGMGFDCFPILNEGEEGGNYEPGCNFSHVHIHHSPAVINRVIKYLENPKLPKNENIPVDPNENEPYDISVIKTVADRIQTWQINYVIEHPFVIPFILKYGDSSAMSGSGTTVTDELLVDLNWTEGSLSLELMAPDGQKFTSTTNTATAWSMSDSNHVLFTIVSPAAGNWSAKIIPVSLPDHDIDYNLTMYRSQVNATLEEDTPIVAVVQGGSAIPRDLNNDGLYEDVNGNGVIDFNDVVLYFNNMDWIPNNEPVSAFDFNKNGQIDFNDVVILFNEM